MAFEIYPAAVTMYPADKQTFFLRGTPPPVIYHSITNGTKQGDGTILQTSKTTDAFVSVALVDGIGGITWTFDSQMLPAGGVAQETQFWLVTAGGGATIRVYVGTTSTVVKNGSGTTLDTIAHTVASGDEYYLEVAGNLLRLSINGTVETEYEVTAATRYPVYAFVSLYGAHATPHITVPAFTGNWNWDDRVGVSNAWTIGDGTFSDSSDTVTTQVTAGTKPGTYTLSCVVGSVAAQTATSTVTVPPLSVLGNNEITMQPSTSIVLKTNYDAAQTSLVTWSIVSGSGSISSNKFTAPSTAGDTVLKAVSGYQDARITVTVPVTLAATTSGGASTKAAKPGEALTITTSMSGTLTWTAQCGSLSGSGLTRTWTAPSTTNIACRITVTNGTDTKILTIEVRDALPYVPNLNITTEYTKKVIVSEAEDGSIQGRSKTPSGQTPLRGELTFQNRELAEWEAMRTFFDDHHPGTPVIYDDLIRSKRHVVYFDSDIRAEFFTSGAIDYAFRIREKVTPS